jgi:dsDNA-binding SOS-regulon protein
MGHIAEPKGVDFIIQSSPLTDNEREELSAFIEKRKAELSKKAKSEPRKAIRKKETPKA